MAAFIDIKQKALIVQILDTRCRGQSNSLKDKITCKWEREEGYKNIETFRIAQVQIAENYMGYVPRW